MTRVTKNASVVLKALLHEPRLCGGKGYSGGGGGGGGSRGGTGGSGSGKRGPPAHKQYRVERRGVFQVQVADDDELR